jgi:hypothetical protein
MNFLERKILPISTDFPDFMDYEKWSCEHLLPSVRYFGLRTYPQFPLRLNHP